MLRLILYVWSGVQVLWITIHLVFTCAVFPLSLPDRFCLEASGETQRVTHLPGERAGAALWPRPHTVDIYSFDLIAEAIYYYIIAENTEKTSQMVLYAGVFIDKSLLIAFAYQRLKFISIQ